MKVNDELRFEAVFELVKIVEFHFKLSGSRIVLLLTTKAFLFICFFCQYY